MHLFGQKKKSTAFINLECDLLSCLPTKGINKKKLKALPGYQEGTVETVKTMTWTHNCVFLIVWMGSEAPSSPENCRGQRTHQRAEGKLFCTTAQIHAHMKHALSTDSRGARTKKSILLPIPTSPEHTSNMFAQRSSHISERRSLFLVWFFCWSDTHRLTHFFADSPIWINICSVGLLSLASCLRSNPVYLQDRVNRHQLLKGSAQTTDHMHRAVPCW